jgi:hypothetical protein
MVPQGCLLVTAVEDCRQFKQFQGPGHDLHRREALAAVPTVGNLNATRRTSPRCCRTVCTPPARCCTLLDLLWRVRSRRLTISAHSEGCLDAVAGAVAVRAMLNKLVMWRRPPCPWSFPSELTLARCSRMLVDSIALVASLDDRSSSDVDVNACFPERILTFKSLNIGLDYIVDCLDDLQTVYLQFSPYGLQIILLHHNI